MQNTFSQSGNNSKWFLKKSFFRIGMWYSRPPPPPFMEKNIFPFWLLEPLPYQSKAWEEVLFVALLFPSWQSSYPVGCLNEHLSALVMGGRMLRRMTRVGHLPAVSLVDIWRLILVTLGWSKVESPDQSMKHLERCWVHTSFSRGWSDASNHVSSEMETYIWGLARMIALAF